MTNFSGLDPFLIADLGIANSKGVEDTLEIVFPEENTPLGRAMNKFTWGQGVAVYSGDLKEYREWTALIKAFHRHEDISDPKELYQLEVGKLFAPQVLIADAPATMGMRDGFKDLAKAISLVVNQTRFDPGTNITFLVTVPQPNNDVAELINYDAALYAGNKSAHAKLTDPLQETNDFLGESDLQLTHSKLANYILDIMVNTQGDSDNTLATLRKEGDEVSTELSIGLQYLYYKLILNFIDCGSLYRSIPSNTRLGLIVSQVAYEWMLARGWENNYSTLYQGNGGPEATMGTYPCVPKSEDDGSTSAHAKVMHALKEKIWQKDPTSRPVAAAYVYASTLSI